MLNVLHLRYEFCYFNKKGSSPLTKCLSLEYIYIYVYMSNNFPAWFVCVHVTWSVTLREAYKLQVF